MAPLDIGLVTFLMMTLMVVLLAAGLPVAFAVGGTAIVFGYLFWGPASFYVILLKASDTMNASVLVAVPLFVFMAFALERAGVAEDLYKALRVWMARLPGGLAAATVIGCMLIAAMSGISATGVLMMGIIGYPTMARYGYDPRLAMGTIMAGGALGALIPPSITFILFAMIADLSVGRLFVGGILPGILLTLGFVLYVLVRCYLRPELGPPVPPDERIPFSAKVAALKGVVLPILLVGSVLGAMFFGVATPTEAAAIGALGALVAAAIHGKVTWAYLLETAERTFVVVAVVMWIIFGANIFSSIYQGIGAASFIHGVLLDWDVSPWVVLILMQLIWILLGCFMDSGSILMLTGPIFVPIAVALGFDPLWLGILFAVNAELGYLTPPFGVNLMIMRSIVPASVKTGDIYRSVWPFLAIQVAVLIFCMAFPEAVLWLPDLAYSR